MRLMKNYFSIVVLITIIVILNLLASNLFAKEEEILTGVVKAVQWRDESNVIAAVLVVTTDAEDEEGKLTTYIDEYQIMDNRIGKELFELDAQTVEVSGIFVEKADGSILLQVKSYEIIKADQEDIIEEEADGDYPEEDSEEPPI